MKKQVSFTIIFSLIIIMSFVSAICSDTDATSEHPTGINFYQKGTAQENPGSYPYTDKCYETMGSAGMVFEYYCQDQIHVLK